MHIMRLVGAAFLMTSALTVAPAAEESPDGDYAARVAQIPEILRNNVRVGTFRESFIASGLTGLRKYDRDRDGLDTGDVEEVRIHAEAAERSMRVAELLRYDLDGDLAVTREEAARVVSFNVRPSLTARPIEQGIATVMSRDVNGDGLVSIDEVKERRDVKLPLSASLVAQARAPAALLALDPNKDGRLTAEEMTTIAEAAFDVVDIDGDRFLSVEEYRVYSKVPRPPAAKVKPPTP